MRPIASWSIRQRRWQVFWWCAGIIFFVVLTLAFYPTIKSQSAQLDRSFDQLSSTTKQLFTDTDSIFSPVGYLSSQIFYLMLPLLLGILAINLGMSLIGKEERSGTIEMLLARPLGRAKLLFGKALAGLVVLLIVGSIAAIATAGMCRLVGLDVSTANVLAATAMALAMAVTFGALAFMLTAFGALGRAISIGLAAFFALGGYIITSLAASVDWLKIPAKAFPFDYYHSAQLLTGRYNWMNALYFLVVTALCLALAWLVFRRRDLVGQ